MRKILEYLARDHDACETRRSAAEVALRRKDWDTARKALHAFEARIVAHLTREEQVLFPALEAYDADAQGLVPLMHMEHGQLRELLRDMTRALGDGHHSSCLRLCEMFNALMQQHKLKEEAWLVPLFDGVADDKCDTLLATMQAIEASEEPGFLVRGSA
jgi:iron-sulfur cluster repair protein YtfE (RIC family)